VDHLFVVVEPCFQVVDNPVSRRHSLQEITDLLETRSHTKIISC
jgi:hypothetical protein